LGLYAPQTTASQTGQTDRTRIEPPPVTITSLLNEAFNGLQALNNRLEMMSSHIYGPTPKASGIEEKQGPMGTLDLARVIAQATSNAMDKLNTIESQL
jgi:hypothetical protein